MDLSLSEAAKQVSTSKSTIWRAVRTGKLSATRDDQGSFRVDPSELHRVFGAERRVPRGTTQDATAVAADVATGAAVDTVELRVRNASIEAQVTALRELLEAEKRRAEEWRDQAEHWRVQAERLTLAPPRRSTWWWWSRPSKAGAG